MEIKHLAHPLEVRKNAQQITHSVKAPRIFDVVLNEWVIENAAWSYWDVHDIRGAF